MYIAVVFFKSGKFKFDLKDNFVNNENTRMLADFYFATLSNDMKIAIQKIHLGAKFDTEVGTL